MTTPRRTIKQSRLGQLDRGPQLAGVAVEVRPGEPVERALRRFKRVVARAGILRDVRGRRWHRTEGQRRREKRRAAAWTRARRA